MKRHAHDGALERVQGVHTAESKLRMLRQLADLDQPLLEFRRLGGWHLHLLPPFSGASYSALWERFAQPADGGQTTQLGERRVGRERLSKFRLLLLTKQFRRRFESGRAEPLELGRDLVGRSRLLERGAALLLCKFRRVLAPLLLEHLCGEVAPW